MLGSFTSGRFRFQVEGSDLESDEARGFDEDFDDNIGFRMTTTGKVPDLGGAPFASWLLARLARLTDYRLGLAGEEHVDGGGYMICFVAYLIPIDFANPKATSVQPLLFNLDDLDIPIPPDRPMASFQFQADTEGAAVVGQRAADCGVEAMMEAFAAALLDAPTDIAPCELVVRDPEWELDPSMYRPRPDDGSCNWYGWDGDRFLGKDNLR